MRCGAVCVIVVSGNENSNSNVVVSTDDCDYLLYDVETRLSTPGPDSTISDSVHVKLTARTKAISRGDKHPLPTTKT